MTITAKVIKDSISPFGVRISTLELEYPRFIHAEVMTHRVFSRNSASSRAIPVSKIIEQVENSPAIPLHFGKNKPGMQASEEVSNDDKELAKYQWLQAAKYAVSSARIMQDIGLHKQVVNRILEPFQTTKVLVTATEWENFLWLRLHEDAQPEIYELAKQIKIALEESEPEKLDFGMWHLPYVNTTFITSELLSGKVSKFQVYENPEGGFYSLNEAIKVSCSSCAQVSYRKLDTSLEKAEDIYKKLVESEPVHASSFEHCAKVMQRNEWPKYVSPDVWIDVEEAGVTHADRQGFYWSGNFKGWIQYRQLIPNNVKH